MAEAPLTPIVRAAYSSSDPLEAREFIEHAYGARLRVEADHAMSCALSLSQTQVGAVTLAELALPLDLRFVTRGQGDYVFTTQIEGISERGDGRDSERYGRGDLFLAVDPQERSTYRAQRARMRTVTLSKGLLDDLARYDARSRREEWRFTARRPIDGGARRWKDTVAMLTYAMADQQASATTLVIGPAVRLLAATALTIFPSTLQAGPRSSERHDAHPDTLRRAIAFIDTNPDLDISLADIARAAYVTPRAIQLAFRRHLDTTPIGYLRHVRLHHAHVQLEAADPADRVTVGRVAMEWGFTNSSRFAAHYRAAYGESPSRTLEG